MQLDLSLAEGHAADFLPAQAVPSAPDPAMDRRPSKGDPPQARPPSADAPRPSAGGPSRGAEAHRHRHRDRLRERFEAGGADAVPDYELLEMILWRAIRRGDTKPLAKRLLAAFGDLNRVLAAHPARLAEVDGVGPAVVFELKLTEAVGHRMARAKVIKKPVLSSWDALLDYLATALAHRETECVRALFLDRKNVLIADEKLADGTVDHVPLYPREVLRRALALGATALILVHNHPSGDPTPSEADLAMTDAVAQGAAIFGIALHDHLIVGKSRHLSFRSEGYL